MSSNRFRRRSASLLIIGVLSLGLAACGSDDEGGNASNTATEAGATTGTTGRDATTGTTGQGGEMTPDNKAPASAGERDPNAPDKAISERPGGPNQPSSP
ncbi:MAG: hypothetical protein H6532_03940 [Thermoleophilales bacterium]|nr:hypothetical protein [Thermoleophilales bacterium]